MRKIIGLIMTILSAQVICASPLHIQVEEYLPTDMDFIFEISNENFDKVTLDCQGFINSVGLQGHNGEKEMMVLDIGECEDIHAGIVRGLQNDRPVCLSLDLDYRAYRVSEQECN